MSIRNTRLEFTLGKFSKGGSFKPHSIYEYPRHPRRTIPCARKTFLHFHTALYLITTTPLHLQSQSFPQNSTDLILRHQPPSSALSVTIPKSSIDGGINTLLQTQINILIRVSFMMRHLPRLMLFTPLIPPSTIRSSSNRAVRPFL